MRYFTLSAVVAASLLSVSGDAMAGVKVSFVQPERFVDIKDNQGFRDLAVLPSLERFLVAGFEKYLPGRDVAVEVIDVDLAGDVEPIGHRGQWLRVMRPITSPAVTFKYTVRLGGEVVQQAEVRLRDMNYQDGFNPFVGSEPLAYENRMLDRWFQRELAPAVATLGR
ncbi:DUF3016 domain-containing protein [Roseateles sp. BYS87W]|uniref:DUF3016 domain-containing protein n=1 Tax=Pelomonas baiyunensis TaxID=3299026 RepID=A0ABW7GX18_9BURK